MADECLKFYGVASVASWENVYADVMDSTAFRKSSTFQSILSRTAAWLRIGELELRRLELGDFDKAKFKDQLVEIKKLVRNHPEDFALQLQKLCQDVGVGLIYTSTISKAPVSGATRWVAGNPLIQMTDRYKMNDQFWFTFFHEAGHIILHGKKDIFLEELESYEGDDQNEKKQMLSHLNGLLVRMYYLDSAVKALKRIYGRLQENLELTRQSFWHTYSTIKSCLIHSALN